MARQSGTSRLQEGVPMAVRTSGLTWIVACQLLALVATRANAAQSGGTAGDKQSPPLAAIPESSAVNPRKAPTGETPASRVLVSEPTTARVLRDALEEAWREFVKPGCQALLTEFSDEDGHSLAASLSKGAEDLQSHLARLAFVEGDDARSCARGALAVTEPGSRVVRVCSRRLVWTWQQNSRHVVAALIHEALHTLGLGENPPSSSEITSRVLKRCGTK